MFVTDGCFQSLWTVDFDLLGLLMGFYGAFSGRMLLQPVK